MPGADRRGRPSTLRPASDNRDPPSEGIGHGRLFPCLGRFQQTKSSLFTRTGDPPPFAADDPEPQGVSSRNWEVSPVNKKTAAQLALTFALLGFACVPAAFAGKGGNGGGGGKSSSSSPTSTLSLTSERIYWPQTNWPSCMTEDDVDQRSFSGSLSGSYSTSFRLCDLSTDGTDAGGEGVQSEVGVAGTLSDLTITAPDGTVTHGVYTGTSKGVSYYEVCVVPAYYASSDTGIGGLVGGTWTVSLSGSISSASWETQVNMTDVNFQQANCPASEQNIIR